MKKLAFQLAHQIKSFFGSWSQALRMAWFLAKVACGRIGTVTFAKESTGEERIATVKHLSTNHKNGTFKFLELTESGEQWRSFKVANLITA